MTPPTLPSPTRSPAPPRPPLAGPRRNEDGRGGATSSTVTTWRLIDDPPRLGSRNMALDHALARCLSHGRAVLRLYAWTRPTVSFGRNEPALDGYSEQAAAEGGLDCVRRPTGGRAVLHDHEVTYAVVAPWGALGSGREAYRSINEVVATALAGLGAPVSVSAQGEVAPLDAGPCFQGPAPGEVVADGRKLVGSAQARVDGVFLQHGSIILSGDQSALASIARGRAADGSPRGNGDPRMKGDERRGDAPAALCDLAPRVGRLDVTAALARTFAERFGGHWATSGYEQRELDEADRLEAERYATHAWTWRR